MAKEKYYTNFSGYVIVTFYNQNQRKFYYHFFDDFKTCPWEVGMKNSFGHVVIKVSRYDKNSHKFVNYNYW